MDIFLKIIQKQEKQFEQVQVILGVFSPCKYKNTELIDGGIRENVPWKIAKQMGADKGISVIFENNIKQKCCSNIIDVVSNSIGILCHELSDYELMGADYLLKIKTPEVSLLDVSKIENLYQLGYVQTKEKIKEIKNIRSQNYYGEENKK